MKKPGLAMHGRHHGIQECLLSLCRSSGVAARKEVLIDDSGLRPADVYLPQWQRGVSYAVDVTVSHPSQSNLTSSVGVGGSASASIRASEARARQKDLKYKAQCEIRGVEFQAVAICCFGGWLNEGEDIVNDLANRNSSRSGKDVDKIRSQYWQRLSLALWRGNARQLLHCSG